MWKHILTLVFKAEKLWISIDGIEVKPITLTTTQITFGTCPLLATKARSISPWEDKNALALIIINNYLDNIIISHIQSCQTLVSAWA
jgi:hypothetical protein